MLDLTSLANLGVPEMLLWLLTFAIMYGTLSHVGETGMPKSQGARAIISLVAAFFVLFTAPASVISVISQMGAGLVLIIILILAIVVFLEAAGIKHIVMAPTGKFDKEGKPVYEEKKLNILEKYPLMFGIAFLLIAILIFIGAGGLALLNLPNIQFSQGAISTIAFFVVIILAIVWMISDPTKKQQR